MVYRWAGAPREATVTVAAYDSFNRDADYVCDGIADDDEINTALAAGAGGKVILLEGNYQITANLAVPADTHLSGMGKGTILTTTDAAGITNMVVVNGDNVTISDMKLVLGAGAGADGSRPNAIYATGRTKLLLENIWIYGDKTVADDGSELRQCGIMWATVTDSKIIGCRSENHKRCGINLDPSCDNNKISDNYCTGCDNNGIRLDTGDSNIITGNNCSVNAMDNIYLIASLHNVISNNTCNGAGGTYSGINSAGGSQYNTVSANICEGNGGMGISIYDDHNTITGNNCNNNTRVGIYVEHADESTITGNCCCGNGRQGINIDESDHSVVSGNTCSDNTWDGILVDYNSHDSVVIGNACYGNDPGGNTYSGICLYLQNRVVVVGNECSDNGLHGIFVTFGNNDCLIAENLCYHQFTGDGIHITGNAGNPSHNNVIRDNSCLSNASDGIEIEGGANAAGSRVFDNRCSGNGGLCLNDGGANTILAVYVVPFSDGTDPQDSGYLIDANLEMARAWLRLPEKVQQVLGLKIYARAVIPSGTTMALEINVNGGASNEAYTTHATAAPNTPSTTSNFAADDVIFWELTSAQIVALLGGDSIEVKVLHEAADGGGVVTNAYIRTVEIEYV